MYQIYKGAKHGLSLKQLKIYAKEEFSDEQMHMIRLCLENGYCFNNIDLEKLEKLSKLGNSYVDCLDDDVLLMAGKQKTKGLTNKK